MEENKRDQKQMILDRLTILSKPVLTRRDVATLEGIKEVRASQIMAICRKRYKGSIPFRTNLITTESYAKMMGIDLSKYCENLHIVLFGKGQDGERTI